MGLFGTSKKKKESMNANTMEAIDKLGKTEDMLQKKSEFLEKKIEGELQKARKAGTKNKRVALNALKKKKQYEKQLQQIDGTLSSVEMQRESLKNASTNAEVLKTMGYAAKALKSAHQNMDVDDVHDMMDDIQEQTELANEISDAIGTSMGMGQDIDEDDLAAELEELEQEDLDEQMLNLKAPSSGVTLPSVPTALPASPNGTDVPVAEQLKEEPEVDDEMAELAAWSSLSTMHRSSKLPMSYFLRKLSASSTLGLNQETVRRLSGVIEID